MFAGERGLVVLLRAFGLLEAQVVVCKVILLVLVLGARKLQTMLVLALSGLLCEALWLLAVRVVVLTSGVACAFWLLVARVVVLIGDAAWCR